MIRSHFLLALLAALLIDSNERSQTFRPWTIGHPFPTSKALTAVVILSSGRVLLFGEGGTTVRSDDGGPSWTPALMPLIEPVYPATIVMALRSIAFDADGEGYPVGDEGACYRTPDDGASWSRHLIGTNLSLRAIVKAHDDYWNAAGDAGTILESTLVPTHVAGDIEPNLLPTSLLLLSAPLTRSIRQP